MVLEAVAGRGVRWRCRVVVHQWQVLRYKMLRPLNLPLLTLQSKLKIFQLLKMQRYPKGKIRVMMWLRDPKIRAPRVWRVAIKRWRGLLTVV